MPPGRREPQLKLTAERPRKPAAARHRRRTTVTLLSWNIENLAPHLAEEAPLPLADADR